MQSLDQLYNDFGLTPSATGTDLLQTDHHLNQDTATWNQYGLIINRQNKILFFFSMQLNIPYTVRHVWQVHRSSVYAGRFSIIRLGTGELSGLNFTEVPARSHVKGRKDLSIRDCQVTILNSWPWTIRGECSVPYTLNIPFVDCAKSKRILGRYKNLTFLVPTKFVYNFPLPVKNCLPYSPIFRHICKHHGTLIPAIFYHWKCISSSHIDTISNVLHSEYMFAK